MSQSPCKIHKIASAAVSNSRPHPSRKFTILGINVLTTMYVQPNHPRTWDYPKHPTLTIFYDPIVTLLDPIASSPIIRKLSTSVHPSRLQSWKKQHNK